MNPSPPPFETLRPLLESVLGDPQPTLHEIQGGASTRRFFRIRAQSGQRAVAMFVPFTSQEHHYARETGRPWPFLEMRELLGSHAIRVPELLGAACEAGWLLLEDLGDTLAQHLEHSPEDKTALYQRAVRDLARAQRSLASLPEHCIAVQRAFDETLLRWEIEHFREWALEARHLTLSPTERSIFDRAAEYLATTIAGWPRGFVHRDYQSRNLMVLPNRALAWIDFQDAMLGPRVYDLVALLGDSYQSFDRAFVDARIAEFCLELELDADESARVEREFELVMVQRKLKDAGRFVFIQHKNGNTSFLKFVEPTIVKARASLARLEAGTDTELQDLAGLLDRVLETKLERA